MSHFLNVAFNECANVLKSSGGIDSASSAIIVFSMCRLVVEAIEADNQQVIADIHSICADDVWLPSTPEQLCQRLFHTCENAPKKSLAILSDPDSRLHGYREEQLEGDTQESERPW